MERAALTLIEEETSTLASCVTCGDVIPAWLGGTASDEQFRCRPCLIAAVRDDLLLLAMELAS